MRRFWEVGAGAVIYVTERMNVGVSGLVFLEQVIEIIFFQCRMSSATTLARKAMGILIDGQKCEKRQWNTWPHPNIWWEDSFF